MESPRRIASRALHWQTNSRTSALVRLARTSIPSKCIPNPATSGVLWDSPTPPKPILKPAWLALVQMPA